MATEKLAQTPTRKSALAFDSNFSPVLSGDEDACEDAAAPEVIDVTDTPMSSAGRRVSRTVDEESEVSRSVTLHSKDTTRFSSDYSPARSSLESSWRPSKASCEDSRADECSMGADSVGSCRDINSMDLISNRQTPPQLSKRVFKSMTPITVNSVSSAGSLGTPGSLKGKLCVNVNDRRDMKRSRVARREETTFITAEGDRSSSTDEDEKIFLNKLKNASAKKRKSTVNVCGDGDGGGAVRGQAENSSENVVAVEMSMSF